jgi:putative hydrolase of the HAD superfamily
MDKSERQRLVSLIRESAFPLTPELPELPAALNDLAQMRITKNCRALLFDVYGTLFCSAAGDIGHATKELTAAPAPGAALESLAAGFGMGGEDMRAFFRGKVAELHQARSAETQWPEVQVDRLWADFLQQARQKTDFPGSRKTPDAEARELALRYELAVNPVYPMPGAEETIAALRKAGRVMGIISNAQFFTPLLFEAFFGGLPEDLGFDPDIVIWSFKTGEAKPSPGLFEAAAKQLEARGIAAGDYAFVGNDMLSDMYGAMGAGFLGILFAGDSRSLRLREDDERLRGLRPDRIIRSWGVLAGLAASTTSGQSRGVCCSLA